MSEDEAAMVPHVGTATKAGQYLEGSPPSPWTTQAPTAPGLYWYRRSAALKAHIVEVELEGETLKANDRYIDDCRGEVTTIEGQWAGPLPPTK
ncbi:MAG TPA: hypothetical protein VN638_11865 [Nitrospiraceae bacterium]|nr:hypothetical protein [Nitrospiraceae bacterium]